LMMTQAVAQAAAMRPRLDVDHRSGLRGFHTHLARASRIGRG
jgi:hypothetical protein